MLLMIAAISALIGLGYVAAKNKPWKCCGVTLKENKEGDKEETCDEMPPLHDISTA